LLGQLFHWNVEANRIGPCPFPWKKLLLELATRSWWKLMTIFYCSLTIHKGFYTISSGLTYFGKTRTNEHLNIKLQNLFNCHVLIYSRQIWNRARLPDRIAFVRRVSRPWSFLSANKTQFMFCIYKFKNPQCRKTTFILNFLLIVETWKLWKVFLKIDYIASFQL